MKRLLPISKRNTIPQTSQFGQWSKLLRNICAHHSRLWNKTLGVSFEKPRKIKEFYSLQGDKVFFAISVIAYILDAIGEEADFQSDIKALIATHPKINIKAMGFVEGWEEMSVWK